MRFPDSGQLTAVSLGLCVIAGLAAALPPRARRLDLLAAAAHDRPREHFGSG